eukprot:4973057-Lingulodinium_polyedra.AAC.1
MGGGWSMGVCAIAISAQKHSPLLAHCSLPPTPAWASALAGAAALAGGQHPAPGTRASFFPRSGPSGAGDVT